MSYELFIARRYLQSKQKTGFLSVISFIAMGGVILGVAALIIMLSVTNGFTGEVKSRLVGMNAHVSIAKYHGGIDDYGQLAGRVNEVPGVAAVAPVVESKLVIATDKEMDGIFVWGVDADSFPSVSDVTDHLRFDPDRHLQLGQLEGYKYPGIVLGSFLADRMRVGPGDDVFLISIADRDLENLLTGFKPRLEPFTVTDLFATGMYHHDDNFAFISLSEAQRIMGLGEAVTSLHLRVDDLDEAVAINKQLDRELGGYPYDFKDWTDLFPELFQWMELEKWVIFIALSLIIVVASFNIMSILSMSILIKTAEIGILRTMGARGGGIRRIFVYQGLFIGVFGTALGCLLGFVVCWMQARFDLITLPADIYVISSLPVDMRISDFAIVSLVSLGICLLASIFPARKAASLQPAEAIRYVM